MTEGTFTDNGNSDWYEVQENAYLHITAVEPPDGTWGGGTLAVQQFIRGQAMSAYNETGVAISFTADFGAPVYFSKGDKVRLTLTGATAPKLHWSIGGKVIRFNGPA